MSHALVLAVNDREGFTEYLGITGNLTGRNAPFRILVPDNWDGTLMVYSRGTGSSVLVEVLPDGTTTPIVDDLGLPILATNPLANVPNRAFPAGDYGRHDELRDELLQRGYALATSDYKPDPRFLSEGKLAWVIEDGYQDTIALTLEARQLLGANHGHLPQRTIHWGRSQGSGIGLKLDEKNVSRLYDGFIEGCTIGAGAPLIWDWGLIFALAFDTAFKSQGGWLEAWGDVGGGDIPETISFVDDVVPVVLNLLNSANFPLFEFVRLVSGMPEQEFYPPGVLPSDPAVLQQLGLPPGLAEAGSEQFNWLFISMLFLTEVRADLEGTAKANGRISQNLNHTYSLSDSDKAYLHAISGGALNANALLGAMNSRPKYAADPNTRSYLRRYYETTGKLRHKTLTMHGKLDGLAIPANETVLKDRAIARREADNLVQVFTEAPGHCNFTVAQWLATIDAMNSWLDTGAKPDSSLFDAPGFDTDFVPPSWPQPVN
jgi:hypothetical protein